MQKRSVANDAGAVIQQQVVQQHHNKKNNKEQHHKDPKIDISKKSEVAVLGSVIETTLANYFLSVSAGELKAMEKSYYAISTSSPIGKLMLGKKEGDELVWNGKKIQIQQIS